MRTLVASGFGIGKGLLLGCTLVLLMLATACGEDPTPTPVPTATPSLYPLSITDSNGNQVVLNGPPERIIAYDSPAVEILFAIGEGARIVGAHEFATYPPEALDLPKVGSSFSINLEKIAELEPDLIFTFYGTSVPDLEGSGVPVLYLETPNDINGIAEQIRMWGKITGGMASAEEAAVDFEIRVAGVLDRLAGIEKGPRVFHDDSLLYTRGPETLVGKVYALLKAENIAHDIPKWGQLSPEVVVERDPEVIISTYPDRPQEFLEDPAFQGVAAVMDGRVYAIDTDLINAAGPRFPEAIEALARLIHPDLYSGE